MKRCSVSVPPRVAVAAIVGSLLAIFPGVSSAAPPGKVSAFKQLDDLDRCVQQRYDADECLARVKTYLRDHPNEDLAVAQRVRTSFQSWVALPFFEAVIKRRGKAVCADKDLGIALLSGLALPGDYPDAVRARAIATGRCQDELEAAVISEVAGEKGHTYLKDNACPILKARGKAPESCAPEPVAKPEDPVPETLPKISKNEVALEKGKAYSGGEGEVVTLIPIQGSDLYLVRFDGMRGPWNGKTRLHRREERGNGAATFWTEHNGRRWNSIVQRGTMTVYAPEYRPGQGFAVGYSADETRSINEQVVLDGWVP